MTKNRLESKRLDKEVEMKNKELAQKEKHHKEDLLFNKKKTVVEGIPKYLGAFGSAFKKFGNDPQWYARIEGTSVGSNFVSYHPKGVGFPVNGLNPLNKLYAYNNPALIAPLYSFATLVWSPGIGNTIDNVGSQSVSGKTALNGTFPMPSLGYNQFERLCGDLLADLRRTQSADITVDPTDIGYYVLCTDSVAIMINYIKSLLRVPKFTDPYNVDAPRKLMDALTHYVGRANLTKSEYATIVANTPKHIATLNALIARANRLAIIPGMSLFERHAYLAGCIARDDKDSHSEYLCFVPHVLWAWSDSYTTVGTDVTYHGGNLGTVDIVSNRIKLSSLYTGAVDRVDSCLLYLADMIDAIETSSDAMTINGMIMRVVESSSAKPDIKSFEAGEEPWVVAADDVEAKFQIRNTTLCGSIGTFEMLESSSGRVWFDISNYLMAPVNPGNVTAFPNKCAALRADDSVMTPELVMAITRNMAALVQLEVGDAASFNPKTYVYSAGTEVFETYSWVTGDQSDGSWSDVDDETSCHLEQVMAKAVLSGITLGQNSLRPAIALNAQPSSAAVAEVSAYLDVPYTRYYNMSLDQLYLLHTIAQQSEFKF